MLRGSSRIHRKFVHKTAANGTKLRREPTAERGIFQWGLTLETVPLPSKSFRKFAKHFLNIGHFKSFPSLKFILNKMSYS